MEDVTAEQLVKALTVAAGKEEEQETLEFLIDNLGEAAALIMAALTALLKESNKDERTLV